jgi:predicted phage terminase large subunit-like protein
MALRRRLTPKEFERKSREILLRMQGLAKPFADDSPEARKRRRAQGEKDHFWFLRTYLPHYFSKPFGLHHRDQLDMLETRGKSLMADAEPREHGKSAVCSFGYQIHQACYQLRHYMLLISDTEELAGEFIQWIKLEFEENPRLRQDFGDLVTTGYWTDTDIVVGGKTRIRGVGHGQRIRGTRFMQWRPDLITVDDFENDINVRNKKLVKEGLKWLLSAAYGSLDRDGTMLMTGTILARVSVLGLLIKHINEKADEFVQRYGVRGMHAVVHSIITPAGLPLWPESLSLDEIEKIRLIVGANVFAAEYMNAPIDDGVIKEEWIRYVMPEELVGRPMACFSGSDPSARHGENNDYKAIIVIARDQETKLLTVAHAFIRRCSIGEMDQAFINRYREFKMLGCGFETNGFQMVVKEDLEKRCQAEGLYPPIASVEHHTDKLLRIGRLGPMIERGALRFIKGHSDQDLLVEQLCALGGNEKDDGPDALEIAVAISERGASNFEYRESGRHRVGLRAAQEGYYA